MEEVVTIFFQGHFSPRSVAANYAGEKGMYVKIDDEIIEHVVAKDAPLILHNIFTYKDLEDVGYDCSINPLHWFFKLKSLLVNNYCKIEGASLAHSHITLDNLAGPNDVKQYIEMIKACIKEYPNKKIVLFGCSRGAAATITTLQHLDTNLLSHIKLVIVEAPFDSVNSVLHSSGWFPETTLNLLRLFTLYNDAQISPLDAVKSDNFPLIPIAFITSKVDDRVPLQNTYNLINVLKEKKHPHLHHLTLEHSHHACMFAHNPHDQQLYVEFVNYLYDLYLL